ncbi:MAG: ATP-binding protein [Opitutae bacterium]|nr:ATP-binding protein [Opitutae bacterium]
MYRACTIFASAVLAAVLPSLPIRAETQETLKAVSINRLEQRLALIDAELNDLASFSMRSGIGSVGFRSDFHEDSHHTEWIEIDLGEETPIDQIVLVPVIWRDTKTGFRADGFPLAFRLVAGNRGDTDGAVIASFGPEDGLLPRVAPLAVSIPEIVATWIRLEASVLSPRAWDGKYILQMDEILVFSGQENIALNKPVRVSSDDVQIPGPRRKQNLVDGFVPYLMDAAHGEQSIAFLGESGLGAHPTMIVDLGSIHELNRIHFHAIELGDTVPQASPLGLSLPSQLIFEGAIKPDFSDAVRLIEYRRETIYDTGPIIMRRFPESACRYIRLIASEPYIVERNGTKKSLLGFAEIELFSKGSNVAMGKAITSNLKPVSTIRSLSALTDGSNLYGQILPIRDWLNELALRHDLETERPVVLAELNKRYARQKTYLSLLGWLAALLAAGIVFTILIFRNLSMRQVAKIKEQLAADLHDELGADLHTIRLLSDMAEEARNSPEELTSLHQRIRRVTEQSGGAVRHCTNMIEADGLLTSMPHAIRRASRRIMANLKNDISIEGEEYLEKLNPRTRFDLILFYNECLVNISRHSGASQFSTQLKADAKEVILSVGDNGRGLSKSKVNGVPKSLKRRARYLRAKVSVESPATGGTRIRLKFSTPRKWRTHEK